MMESLREIFFKTDRIHYSMFDVGRSLVSHLIRLDARGQSYYGESQVKNLYFF